MLEEATAPNDAIGVVVTDPTMSPEEPNGHSEPATSTSLSRIVGDATTANNRVHTRNFLFLGCETKKPYGPNIHTAQLFLDLFTLIIERYYINNHNPVDGQLEKCQWKLSIKVCDVQKGQFPSITSPDEWDDYDGVILPGSFSSAYDDDSWIQTLKAVIQSRIVGDQRKTLAICFGHQIMAQSFFGNNSNGDDSESSSPVVKAPAARTGRCTMETTLTGRALLEGKLKLDLFCSHGDMVQRLPTSAVCLGGSERVPIETAAYYGTKEEALAWKDSALVNRGATMPTPFAISFQSHPEYAASIDLGLKRTLEGCMDAMESRGQIDKSYRMTANQDAYDAFDQVQDCSVETIAAVGRILGWFPPVP